MSTSNSSSHGTRNSQSTARPMDERIRMAYMNAAMRAHVFTGLVLPGPAQGVPQPQQAERLRVEGQHLEDAMAALSTVLDDATPDQIVYLCDTQKDGLLRVWDAASAAVRLGVVPQDAVTRLVHTQLRLRRGGAAHVTTIFEDFIRGVTYFADEQPNGALPRPIYHRLASCGPRDPRHQGELGCVDDLSPEVRARRRHRIERCYLERLIYDCIFAQLSLQFAAVGDDVEFDEMTALPVARQDAGHRYQLDTVVRDAFRTCFRGTELFAIVNFHESNLPIHLTVHQTVTNAGVQQTTILTFKRHLVIGARGWEYLPFVDCVKELPNGQRMSRVTSFDHRPPAYELLSPRSNTAAAADVRWVAAAPVTQSFATFLPAPPSGGGKHRAAARPAATTRKTQGGTRGGGGKSAGGV
jgi:hypothetical protein